MFEVMSSVIEPQWHTSIGRYAVIKYPGFPSPHGELAHFYLVPTEDGSGIAFVAHRWFSRLPDEEKVFTHYDWVIERMIASLRFAKN